MGRWYFKKKNYVLYDNVVLFDIIYDTDIYKMVFVFLTGFDNYKFCVSFGVVFFGDKKSRVFYLVIWKFFRSNGL